MYQYDQRQIDTYQTNHGQIDILLKIVKNEQARTVLAIYMEKLTVNQYKHNEYITQFAINIKFWDGILYCTHSPDNYNAL